VTDADENEAESYELAFEEAGRALDAQERAVNELRSRAQERAVNELRSRAGVLIAAAAITTSFFGSRAITGDELSVWIWLAVVAFIVVGGCVLMVLWPRSDWSFSASAADIIAEYIEPEPVKFALVQRDLAVVPMTDEMLELARANAAEAGVENVEFVKGYLEDIPLPAASVDVVISNCVINLAADKRVVLAEAARVLRPGGRFAVSDVIADEGMDDTTRADMQQWTGCIAGALSEAEFRAALADAGLVDVEIRATHRVHEYAGSAIVRARKP
jgi:Methyltransferase domain